MKSGVLLCVLIVKDWVGKCLLMMIVFIKVFDILSCVSRFL